VVEHFLGKEEVWGSIPHNGSIQCSGLLDKDAGIGAAVLKIEILSQGY
jgi:hypothetical protein